MVCILVYMSGSHNFQLSGMTARADAVAVAVAAAFDSHWADHEHGQQAHAKIFRIRLMHHYGGAE